MRYEIKPEKNFQPITISITIENQNELNDFVEALTNTADWTNNLFEDLKNIRS
jgi:hypothetical protein